MDILTGLQYGAMAAGGGGLLYGMTITTLAAISVFARSATRRRDARTTLALLLRRHADHDAS
ncbi:hypothetical protein [Nonomuraea guangzhouensis]|uniref:Uncharacterized protein n=1 Tax=Nonomuraea guangzhouensis TaxID=1291555 RepID=A0ABW4GHR1_9ACTN|nr:hypothetical protein [Nonomuraea guangzhouensis]